MHWIEMIIYTHNKRKPKKKPKKSKGEVYKKHKPEFTPMRDTGRYTREKTALDLVESKMTTTQFAPAVQPKYEDEMLERELAARKEIEEKKKRVAILVNKSGYQYLGDAPKEIIHGLGKK